MKAKPINPEVRRTRQGRLVSNNGQALWRIEDYFYGRLPDLIQLVELGLFDFVLASDDLVAVGALPAGRGEETVRLQSLLEAGLLSEEFYPRGAESRA